MHTMQSVRDYQTDTRTAYEQPQPREERLRIPGQRQQGQMRMRSQPDLRTLSRRALPGHRTQAERHEAYRTPRAVYPPTANRQDRRKHEAMYLESPPFERPMSPESDSEMTMGILDYYLQASYPSPLVRVASAGTPQNEMAAFDFGLEESNQTSEPCYTYRPTPAIQPRKSSLTPPSPPRQPLHQSSPSPPRQARHRYTLFPKDEPSTPRLSVHSNNGSTTSRHSVNSSQRPRTASMASSERSRSDSCMSVRLQGSATLSSPKQSIRPHSSSAASGMRNTSGSQQHTSICGKLPSRWSGETIDVALDCSPARNASDKDRDSSSTLVSSSSSSWPTGSFFEDDEDEKVPLRRKVVDRLRGSRSSGALRAMANSAATASGKEELGHKKSASWARRLINFGGRDRK